MNAKILLKEFARIKHMGYIKTINQSSNAVGRTFEELLGIKENMFAFADYYGIELKCISKRKDDRITLFSLEPESIKGNVISKIAKLYGYEDKKYKTYNILNTTVTGKGVKYISKHYKGIIYNDIYGNRLNLLIYNRYDMLVDHSASWNIERLHEKIKNKCEYLAVIKATRKKFENCYYIKYDEISLYRFINIKKFIDAIENGIISINFKITLRERNNELCYHNHGTSFVIRFSDLGLVFEKIL